MSTWTFPGDTGIGHASIIDGGLLSSLSIFLWSFSIFPCFHKDCRRINNEILFGVWTPFILFRVEFLPLCICLSKYWSVTGKTLLSGLIFSLVILYFQTFQITCRLAMRINKWQRTFVCFRLFAVGHCPHTSTLACGHLSTFSTFVHSRLFVSKHWLHINNTSHGLSPLFIFIFLRLPPRPHCPFINYRKCCP